MRFVINRPVTTSKRTVVVDGALAIGVSRFQVEVIDDLGMGATTTCQLPLRSNRVCP